MKSIQIISQDLFDKIRSRFTNLEMGDEAGAVTINPADARFFDFDVVVEGVNLGRVSMSLNAPGALKVYYSQGITENRDTTVKQEWFNFLKEMRMFAMRRLLRFDTRDIAKTNLDKNDFKVMATTSKSPTEEDQTMNESKWNNKSSKKTSRAVRGSTEVIVRHANPVDEMYAGARSQKKNIKSIFIQSKDGERYKYPFIHTAGAFAMAQHIDHGGVPHDPAGKAIVKMSEQIAQLHEFQRQVQHTSLHDDAMGITERAVGKLQELKAHMMALGKKQHYESWMESFNQSIPSDAGLMELDPVTMEDYKSKFTQSNFKEELAGYFPLIHSIMQEVNEIDLDSYVENAEIEESQPAELKDSESDEFMEWADAVEQGKLTSDQVENLKVALSDLTSSGEPQQLGDRGSNAWNFFNGAAAPDSDSDVFPVDLKNKFAEAAEQDPDADALEVFKAWASEDYPELLDELALDSEQEPEASVSEDEYKKIVVDPHTFGKPESLIREVAKIVKGFYNKDNESVGPFNGGEGILIKVEKQISEKFGESAGQRARDVAEQFMEKLTAQWHSEHGAPDQSDSEIDADGLVRLKELVGSIKRGVESIGDQGQSGADFNNNIMPSESTELSESNGLYDILRLSGIRR